MADFYILYNILEILIAVIYLKIITGLSYKLESLYQFISRQKYLDVPWYFDVPLQGKWTDGKWKGGK